MKKYKLLSWVLSLVMALTVFSIPAAGYATGEGEENGGDTPEISYYIGWSVYDEDVESYVPQYRGNGAEISFGDFGGSSITVYQKEGEEYSMVPYDCSYVWTNSDPSVANLLFQGDYDEEQYDYEYFLSDQTETTVETNYLAFVPKGEGSTNLSVSVYNGDSLLTTISFTVVVSADDPQQYRFGWSDNDGGAKVLPADTETVNFCEIGRENWINIYSNEFREWNESNAPKIVWKISDPSLATVSYYVLNEEEGYYYAITSKADEKEMTTYGFNEIMINPKKEGSLVLTAQIFDAEEATEPVDTKTVTIAISDSDLVHYRLGFTDEEDSQKLLAEEVDYADIGDNYIYVMSDDSGEMTGYYSQKQIWKNETPAVASIGFYDEDGNFIESDDPQVELSDGTSGSIYIIPQAEGLVKLTVEAYYESDDADPVAVINLNVNITQKDIDKYKYEQYLDRAGLSYVDYDTQVAEGWIEDIKDYNNNVERDSYKIDNLDNLTIKVTIKDKVYNVTIDKKNYAFTSKKFDRVSLGTKAIVTFTMGKYSKTINSLVSKWIDPKITAATYIYNGKSRKASITVKYGSTTLKKGTDYEVSSDSRKSVGRAEYYVYSTDNCKYRFGDGGYFKIIPKGSYIRSLKGQKRSIRVTWKKQSEKMSTGRINGYQIKVATNSAFTKNKKTLTVKGYSNTAKTVKYLKSGKRYYVKVRTYKTASGTTYYSSWSKAYSVTVK